MTRSGKRVLVTGGASGLGAALVVWIALRTIQLRTRTPSLPDGSQPAARTWLRLFRHPIREAARALLTFVAVVLVSMLGGAA